MNKVNGFSRDWEWKEDDPTLKKQSNKARPFRAKKSHGTAIRNLVCAKFNLPITVTNNELAERVISYSGWKKKKTKAGNKKLIERFGKLLFRGRDPKNVTGENFYRSPEWRKLRYEALIRCGRACMCCGAKPSDGIILHVDHVKPRSKYPLLELDINNLQVLCEDCNMGKSNIYEHDFR